MEYKERSESRSNFLRYVQVHLKKLEYRQKVHYFILDALHVK